jgi:outer membrane beta-barrel protein
MTRRLGTWTWTSLAFCLCLWPSHKAQAKLRFAGEAPKIYTLQPRTHLYQHTLQLGAATLPLDAFYVGFAVHGAYTYHFNDLWAWEVIRAGYSFDFDTGLIGSLAGFGAAVQVEQINRVRILLGTHAQLTPLVGKIALVNRGFFDAETHFLLGAGLLAMQGQNGVAGGGVTTAFRPAIDLGIGIDVFVTRPLAVRLDIRDAIAFGAGSVLNVLEVSLALNVSFGTLSQAPPVQGSGG